MTKKDFLNFISMFLQNPEDIATQGEYIAFSNGGYDYELTIAKSDDGALLCQEPNTELRMPAVEWVVTRLAHLEVLAKAVKEYAEKQITKYISVSCHQIDDDARVLHEDTVEALLSRIKGASKFSTSVYYLTAEAGEGKSVVVYKLAYLVADSFLKRQQKWLFVPIELGGRPFMRLDEMILGALSKCYRYNSCYLESFMELVKQGRIVLGLDGFEEMAVPGAEGDIVSSLATLLNDLDSQGQVVFSARTAYYTYSQMRSRSLFKGIPGRCDVDFYEYQLDKWGPKQFVSLMEAYGFDSEESQRARKLLGDALGDSHPILTRAVLAHSLVKNMADSHVDDSSVAVNEAIECFRNADGREAVARFVEMLLTRETRKWVSRDQLATPVLTVDEHKKLLMAIAEEMWRADTESLRDDVLMSVTEFVCEDLRKSPSITKQCKERIIDHVMLSPEQNRFKKFCHADFMQFFLGYSFAMRLLEGESLQGLSVDLDRKVLPLVTLAECSREIVVHGKKQEAFRLLKSMICGASRVSCLSQNVASLLLLLHDDKATDKIELTNLYCSRAALDSSVLSNIVFHECCLETFENNSISNGGVSFIDCDIPIFYLPARCILRGVSFNNKSLPSLIKRSSDGSLPDCSDPAAIAALLRRAGATVECEDIEDVQIEKEEELVLLFFKVVGLFKARTYISENLLKTKLGVNFSRFNAEIRELMIQGNVLHESPARDGTSQSVFKLSVPAQELDKFRVACKGSFQRLVQMFKNQ